MANRRTYKQPAFATIIACKQTGFSDWDNLPLVQEIGYAHGDVRCLEEMPEPHWLSTGRQLSKALSDLEIGALEGGFGETEATGSKPTDATDMRKAILRQVTCAACGKSFTPRTPTNKFCSDQCRKRATKERNRAVRRDRRLQSVGILA